MAESIITAREIVTIMDDACILRYDPKSNHNRNTATRSIITDYNVINEPLIKECMPFLAGRAKDDGLVQLNRFLYSRSILWDYKEGKELDEYVCKELKVNPVHFGRMTEYQGLVALKYGFTSEDDDISIWPAQTELLYFGYEVPYMNTAMMLHTLKEAEP